MPKKNRPKESDSKLLEFVRGGKSFPATLLQHRKAEVTERLTTRLAEKSTIEQAAARYWSQLQELSSESRDKADASDELRGLIDKLAKKKLIPPSQEPVGPGIMNILFTVRATPPYDYAFTRSPSIAPPSVVSASANQSGQMECRINADIATPSYIDYAYAEIGQYFRPPDYGFVGVWANPSFAFTWWANSISPNAPATSVGKASVGIYGERGTEGQVIGVSDSFPPPENWNVNKSPGLAFDFGSVQSSPLFVQAWVDPTVSYSLYVSCCCEAGGMGWPGSVAGANLNMTVPSITYAFSLNPFLPTGIAHL